MATNNQSVYDPYRTQLTTTRYPYSVGTPQLPAGNQPATQTVMRPPQFGGAYQPPPSNPPNSLGGAYPGLPLSYFQPRQPLEGPPNPKLAVTRRAEEQRRLVGPAAQFLPIAPNRPLTRGDIPLLELGLNYEQLLQAERDRQAGYSELVGARGIIGADPASMRARELLTGFANEGPFGQQIQDQNISRIQNAGAIDLQRARRSAAEDLARRGLSGGVPAAAFEDLELSRGAQTQGQITDFLNLAAEANRRAQQEATEQLRALGSEDESRRLGLSQAIANLFIDTERAPISLAGLIPKTTKGERKLYKQAV